jgi:hypothetical protein
VSVYRAARFDGATTVVVGDVEVAQEVVGFFEGGDAGQAELFDEAVLVGQEPPLDAALGLGGVGAEDLDVEFMHGSCELSDGGIVPKFFFDGGLAIHFVEGVFVDVKGDGASPEAKRVPHGGHEVEGVFDGHEATEEDLACGIVDEDQEHTSRAAAFEPVVVGPV